MARVRTESLTEELYQRFCGAEAESRASQALLLCTVDADGQPRPSMLGYFEVAAPDRRRLRLAVYSDSRTCANLRERGRATLVVVDAGLVCYINATAEIVELAMRGAPYNAKVTLRIEDVVFDEASPDLEPGVGVTSGITCSPRHAEAAARARAVLAELIRDDA